MIIDLNTQENVKFTLFPDNQPHVNIVNAVPGDVAYVVVSLTNSIKMMQLLQVSDALDTQRIGKFKLFIPYLMGARFDRVMNPGDSFDLRVVAKLINSCGFQEVHLYDPHSDVAPALINNAIVHTNEFLIETHEKNNVLICPDAGAAKKIKDYFKWNTFSDVVYCIKERSTIDGSLKIKVLEPGKCQARNCVIIDDICDGGGTFLGIADQIEPNELTLIVTHGIFSKGFSSLEGKFTKIVSSDSYPHSDTSKILTTIPCPII